MLRAACFVRVIFPACGSCATAARQAPQPRAQLPLPFPKAAPESIRRTEPCQHKAGAEGQRARGRPGREQGSDTILDAIFMPDAPFRIFAYNKTEAPWW